MLKLPNFLIVGAQKAGTTAMYYSMANHSQVFVPATKEINYFNEDTNYSKGVAWYAAHFVSCPEGSLACESTPEYMYDPRVPERMAAIVPDAKLVVMLRNPVDRAYSAYWHAVRYGYEYLSFEEAIDAERARLKRSAIHRRYNSYVDRGYYAEQLERLYRFYDPARIHVVITEEYTKNRKQALTDVARFLGISRNEPDYLRNQPKFSNAARMPRYFNLQRCLPFLSRNFPLGARILSRMNLKNSPYPTMKTETRLYLQSRFRDSNRALEDLIKRTVTVWAS